MDVRTRFLLNRKVGKWTVGSEITVVFANDGEKSYGSVQIDGKPLTDTQILSDLIVYLLFPSANELFYEETYNPSQGKFTIPSPKMLDAKTENEMFNQMADSIKNTKLDNILEEQTVRFYPDRTKQEIKDLFLLLAEDTDHEITDPYDWYNTFKEKVDEL